MGKQMTIGELEPSSPKLAAHLRNALGQSRHTQLSAATAAAAELAERLRETGRKHSCSQQDLSRFASVSESHLWQRPRPRRRLALDAGRPTNNELEAAAVAAAQAQAPRPAAAAAAADKHDFAR